MKAAELNKVLATPMSEDELQNAVIALCKANDIPLLATFQYDDRSNPDAASFVTTFDQKSDCAPCVKIAGCLIVDGYAAYMTTRRS